jgi:hypothetical protein
METNYFAPYLGGTCPLASSMAPAVPTHTQGHVPPTRPTTSLPFPPRVYITPLFFFYCHSKKGASLFFKKQSIDVDIYTRMSTHPYEHTHVYSTPISTSERLSRLDLEIHEVGHQEHIAIDGDVAFH